MELFVCLTNPVASLQTILYQQSVGMMNIRNYDCIISYQSSAELIYQSMDWSIGEHYIDPLPYITLMILFNYNQLWLQLLIIFYILIDNLQTNYVGIFLGKKTPQPKSFLLFRIFFLRWIFWKCVHCMRCTRSHRGRFTKSHSNPLSSVTCSCIRRQHRCYNSSFVWAIVQ